MKIVFFGEDAFSARALNSLIKANYQVVAVVTPLYDNFIYKRLEKIAEENNLLFFRAKDINADGMVLQLKELAPDLMVITHFEKLLKKPLLSIPPRGCINLHPSLLPKYRGMAPQHWPIINGDTETGISVHYVEEGIDTGNILIQKTVPIAPNMYVSELQMQMLPLYDTIVADAVKLIETNGYEGVKQDLSKGSLYGKFKKGNAEITDEMSSSEAYNLIRAISKPYMGAFYKGYKIWKAHIAETKAEEQLLLTYTNTGFYTTAKGENILRLKNGVILIDDYELIN